MLPCIDILQWSKVHEYQQGFSAVIKNYSTCILFIPTEVTTELVNTIEALEIVVTIHYYYQVTASNTHHPSHMLSHTSRIRTSNKERGNNMHLLIRDKGSHLINHPIK
jgi:hypothetical protein